MLRETFKIRFDELEEKFEQICFGKENLGQSWAEPGDWKEWAVSALNLILAVFGDLSPHYNCLVTSFKACNGERSQVNELKGIFLSAKNDFEGGYVFNVDLRVSGEVFGDFVIMARQALGSGNKDVAAVLACAALEDALKRLANANGLIVDEKSMKEVVNALKSKRLVSGAQKSLLDAMPKIRDFAMHARWDKIAEPDVSSVIGFVEQLLLSKFSSS